MGWPRGLGAALSQILFLGKWVGGDVRAEARTLRAVGLVDGED
jgi:hypothetical protein